jgi:hypothetical protein
VERSSRSPVRREVAQLADPLEREAWFRELPAERRAAFTLAWRSGLERGGELMRLERRRALVEHAKMAGLFALGDLVAPRGDAWSLLWALVVGSGVSLVLERLDAGRLSSGVIGMSAFFLLQWIERGGLSALHMLLFFPFGCACAYRGWQREERHTG